MLGDGFAWIIVKYFILSGQSQWATRLYSLNTLRIQVDPNWKYFIYPNRKRNTINKFFIFKSNPTNKINKLNDYFKRPTENHGIKTKMEEEREREKSKPEITNR